MGTASRHAARGGPELETPEFRTYADLERRSDEHEYVTVFGERLGARAKSHVYVNFGEDAGLALTQQAR